MSAKLKHFLRLSLTRPFVLAYLADGHYASLLAMCDCVEEAEISVVYVDLARALRAAIFTALEG